MNIYSYKYKDPKGKFKVTVKDNIATKDAPTTGSSKLLEDFEPSYDAHIVENLRKNDFSIVAKTHLDEFGLGGTGLHSAYGQITNPLNEKHIIGGSSSGAACSLLIDKDIRGAIASDTGDSIRLPASYGGLVGYKPSYGAISRYGLYPFANSLDTIGWFTHNVDDSAYLSKSLFVYDKRDLSSKKIEFNYNGKVKPKKIGIIFEQNAYQEVIKNSMNKVIDKLKSDGIEIEFINKKKADISTLTTIYKAISFTEASMNLANLSGIAFGKRKDGSNWSEMVTNTRTEGFGDLISRRLFFGSFFSHQENQKSILELAKKGRRFHMNWWEKELNKYDAVIFPASTNLPPKVEDVMSSTSLLNVDGCFTSMLLLSNFLGNPSMTIPLGKKDNLPYGLNINTKRFTDDKLHSIAKYIEEVIGGSNE